jgi:hypothetical protein
MVLKDPSTLTLCHLSRGCFQETATTSPSCLVTRFFRHTFSKYCYSNFFLINALTHLSIFEHFQKTKKYKNKFKHFCRWLFNFKIFFKEFRYESSIVDNSFSPWHMARKILNFSVCSWQIKKKFKLKKNV